MTGLPMHTIAGDEETKGDFTAAITGEPSALALYLGRVYLAGGFGLNDTTSCIWVGGKKIERGGGHGGAASAMATAP
jgi:hypothetical protein